MYYLSYASYKSKYKNKYTWTSYSPTLLDFLEMQAMAKNVLIGAWSSLKAFQKNLI